MTKTDTSSHDPAAVITIPLLPAAAAGDPTRRPHVTGIIRGKTRGIGWLLIFEKSPNDA